MFENEAKLNVSFLSKYKQALKNYNPTFDIHKTVVIEELLRNSKPLSIYLTGSFSRNEGPLELSEGRLAPLRDYDILIVVNERVKNEVIKETRERIHKRLGLQDPYSRNFKFGGFTVWITQVEMKNLNAMPLLKIFELKESSKLLWGKDIREKIHLSFEDVSPYNGALILFSKIESLLGLFSFQGLRERNPEKSIDFYYECLKVYVEIGSCLNLLAKVYEPSFVDRSNNLYSKFNLLFPELKEMNKSLPSLIIDSAHKRLLIESDHLREVDFGKLLLETSKDLKLALWYYLDKAYQLNVAWSPTFASVFDEYRERLDTRLLDDFFCFFLKRKFGFQSRFVQKLAVRAYLRYTLLKFFFAARKKGYEIKLSLILARQGNVMLRLWLTGFTLLECVTENLTVDETALVIAINRLSELLSPNSLQDVLSTRNTELKFLYAKKKILDLLDLSDKAIHQKG